MKTIGKIRFRSQTNEAFTQELYQGGKAIINDPDIKAKAGNLLKFKVGFYSTLFLLAYCGLYVWDSDSGSIFTINYIFFGLAGIIMAFNISHDAVHGTVFKNKKLNMLVYNLTFNLQGVSAYLWKIRHIKSHHIFPNVDGCDADVDDNPFIRLSPYKDLKYFHRYQYLYALPLYMLYTLHWIFIKDFIYLRKRELANLGNIKHHPARIIELLSWKAVYLLIFLILPLVYTSAAPGLVVLSFFIMHFVISLFFVLSLVISHLAEETDFPRADENGVLPYTMAEHQLAVSLDYHPRSAWGNFIFGGFNSHSAHHLFPAIAHTYYPELSVLIKKLALKHNYCYNESSILNAIRSHFRWLYKMGNPSDKRDLRKKAA